MTGHGVGIAEAAAGTPPLAENKPEIWIKK
jgi:hypothetical protein